MGNESESIHRTRFERVVDNVRFRMFFTGFMCLIFILNLVLAAISFHLYPNEVDGALAYEIVLSIVTCAYSVFFLWRNLDGCSKKRVWAYFGLNLTVIAFWLAAFFALAVELGKTGASGSDSSGASSSSQGGQSSSGSSNNSRRLFARDSSSDSSAPAIGCVVLDVFVAFMFGVNAVYIYFRQQKMFPKYAELTDDGDAFNAEMTQETGQDEEAGPEEATHNHSAAGGYSSYGPYQGQDDYRPGGQSYPPRRDYDAQHDEQQHGYGGHATYSPEPPYPQTGTYNSPYAGRTAYSSTAGPQNGAHETAAYAGRTAYSQPPHPGVRVTSTPYPRDSMAE